MKMSAHPAIHAKRAIHAFHAALPQVPARSLRLRPNTVLRLGSLGALLGWLAIAQAALAQTAVQAAGSPAAKSAAARAPSASCPKVLQHTFPRLQDEKPQNLCQYAGRVVLVVNTASYCGFTGQYEDLEALYARYQPRGLVILGFPSNDFGRQEPGSNKEIAEFCFNTYGVKFPMFAKSSVSGAQQNALFAQLAQATGTTPKWNFYKYLIDRQGRVVDSYSSMTNPSSRSLKADIEKLL